MVSAFGNRSTGLTMERLQRERPDLGPRGARQIRGADGRRIGKGRAAVSGLVRDEPVSRGGRGLRVTYWLASRAKVKMDFAQQNTERAMQATNWMACDSRAGTSTRARPRFDGFLTVARNAVRGVDQQAAAICENSFSVC